MLLRGNMLFAIILAASCAALASKQPLRAAEEQGATAAPTTQEPATTPAVRAAQPAPADRLPADSLIDVQRGTLPIVITAPHGGSTDIPKVPLRTNRDAFRFVTGMDQNTSHLAHTMANELEKRLGAKPYFVTARFHRKYIDANRAAEHAYESPAAKPYYDGYHDTIAEFCREILKNHGTGLLIDVHGQAIYKDEILVGTVGATTVPLLLQRFGAEALVGKTGMVGELQASGLRTMPAINAVNFHVPKFDGGFTVQNYGSHKPGGLEAIQFEFGSNYRSTEHVDDTARKAAAAVERFHHRYLVRPNPPKD
jgi:N-formylglutamate amidohydrolase